jgi:hypothetical protein
VSATEGGLGGKVSERNVVTLRSGRFPGRPTTSHIVLYDMDLAKIIATISAICRWLCGCARGGRRDVPAALVT